MSRAGSLRWRLTLLATAAVLAVLVGSSILLLARQRDALVEQLDDTLGVEAARIAASIGDGGVPTPLGNDDDRVVVVETVGGPSRFPDTDDGSVRIGGERMRYAASDAPEPGAATVFVAAPLDDVDEAVGELRSSLLLIVPVATAVLGIVVWVVTGRVLRPVERIRVEVDAIGLRQLHRRVPQPPGGDEIARLAATMNEMLARLEASALRQEQFVSDASHELRTPLTRMRTELEVDEHRPERADPATTRRSLLEEIAGLQRLIDDLLTLARGDATTASRRAEPVDLDELVRDEVRRRPASTVVIDSADVVAVQVFGVEAELRRVVANLLDNAVRHASGRVVVGVAEEDVGAVLTVTDDGDGIPVERREEVFERFTRLDEARTGGARRSGLGLAIVADIVRRHGGSVIVGDGPAGGARLVVSLPYDGAGGAQA